MRVQIHVTRAKDETPAQLERIPAQAMLLVAGRPSASPGLRVIGAKKVQNVGLSQTCGAICDPPLVNQQRERNSGFLPEKTGVVPIAKPHGSQVGSLLLDRVFVFAQLRDMLAAEESSIVAEEDQDRRLSFPKRPETEFTSVSIRQDDAGKRLAE